jgi:hypothetical protein
MDMYIKLRRKYVIFQQRSWSYGAMVDSGWKCTTPWQHGSEMVEMVCSRETEREREREREREKREDDGYLEKHGECAAIIYMRR